MKILRELRFRLGTLRHAHWLDHELRRYRDRNAELENKISYVEDQKQQLQSSSRGSSLEESDSFVDPSRLIWIFGNPRTGSTWLSQIMGELHAQWDEPYIGVLFGNFMQENRQHVRRGENFILGANYQTRAIREFTLWNIGVRFPEGKQVAIKEPNGALGASLLSAALPESSFIFLVRDPRDIVASGLDANTPGGWRAENRKRQGLELERPETIVIDRAEKYVQRISASKAAYESHEGPKIMLKYEDLRADTLEVMLNLYSALGIEIDRPSVSKAVEKHSWENVPDEKKGKGKGKRKATPGGWKEDLTEGQIEKVEKITGPLMEQLGYEKVT